MKYQKGDIIKKNIKKKQSLLKWHLQAKILRNKSHQGVKEFFAKNKQH